MLTSLARMKKAVSIGVFLPFALRFGRAILHGVQTFAARKPGWRVVVSDTAHAPPPKGSITGMIGAVGSRAWLDFARSCQAAVNVSNSRTDSPLPRVVSDDVAAGRMAAEHLMQQGFRRFVFVKPVESLFGRQRRAGFLTALAAQGHSCTVMDGKAGFVRSLARLEKPVAVFSVTDTVARQHIQRLLDRGLRVPEDVAVLGMDNDEFESQISPVAISSVAPDGEKIGFEAARLLDRLLRGGKAPAEPIRIAPLYVMARRSTDRFMADHPIVAKALRILKTRPERLATVDAVAAEAGVGRRTLERLFQKEIGSPIYRELCRAKLEAVMPEILRGDAPMFEIAARAGFTDARLFNNVCRRIYAKTPGQLRREAKI